VETLFKNSKANEYNNASNVGYGKYSVSLGGYYLPDYNSFSVMLKELL
jgi:hypothetical protein